MKIFFANLQRSECPDEETNKLPDDKICQRCSFCIYQFLHRLLGSSTSISENVIASKDNSTAVKDGRPNVF